MKKLYAIFLVLVGAALYRWRGHASKYKKYLPRPFNQILFSAPYAYIAGFWWFLVLPLTTLALLTGHGNFFLRGSGGDDETTEFIIKWTKPHLPLYWYRALGLSMTGILITLPAGIATGNPYLALSGALKGVSYTIADKLDWGTDGGEWLTGGFLSGALCYVYLF